MHTLYACCFKASPMSEILPNMLGMFIDYPFNLKPFNHFLGKTDMIV